MPTPCTDFFSADSADYARYRPHYPESLFRWLAETSKIHDAAWDCACGSGQAALAMARYYRHVAASDVSTQQVAAAASHPRVTYHVASAEHSALRSHSQDIVTIAQALHWIDTEQFRSELERVLKPDGLVAAWCYRTAILPGQDKAQDLLHSFYAETLGEYWPPERHHVENGYADLNLGIRRLETPEFAMQAEFTIEELCGYISTWSAVRIYRYRQRHDPLPQLEYELRKAMQPYGRILIEWPMSVIAGPLV